MTHLDVETILNRALDPVCELIALGQPGDISQGAARIVTSDAAWKDSVRALMDAATFVVIVPLNRPGTLWEVDELRLRGHLHKTVFVMPEPFRTQPSGITVTTEPDRIWDAGILRGSRSRPEVLNWGDRRQLASVTIMAVPLRLLYLISGRLLSRLTLLGRTTSSKDIELLVLRRVPARRARPRRDHLTQPGMTRNPTCHTQRVHPRRNAEDTLTRYRKIPVDDHPDTRTSEHALARVRCAITTSND